MGAEELLQLAGRLESADPMKLDGLNNQVARAVGWERITPSQMGRGHRSHGGWIAPEDFIGRMSDGKPILDSLHGTDIWRDPKPYITSLDAAMSLVPEGWDWSVSRVLGDGSFAPFSANLSPEDQPYPIDAEVDTEGRSAALALCAAALRARAAINKETE